MNQRTMIVSPREAVELAAAAPPWVRLQDDVGRWSPREGPVPRRYDAYVARLRKAGQR